MKKITFRQINKWVNAAKKPLDDKALEDFQVQFFGEFRHEYYRFFHHMVAEMKPKVALEIGIDHGHTLAHMAAANADTMVIGIDKRDNCANKMPKYPNAQIYYDNSLGKGTETFIEDMVYKYGKIGIVFQDSSHHYNDSHAEFEIYSKYLDKNAIWCVDDVLDVFHDPNVDPPGKSMVEYFDELPGRKKTYEGLHHGSVIGVSLL
jgi:cephalosporin hydroxylase